jgi:coproporphyrinogen III oxidase-like Fe-S oxidoreductase
MARGFGLEPPPGALSFRYGHGRSVTGYTRAVDTAPLAIRDAEWIDAAMRAEESIMLGLRLREGVSLEHAGALAEARELAGAGLLVLDGRRARVTARGEDVLNQLALRLATRCA